MKISTKGGDKGETSLMFGRRVSKACLRVKAYGAVDEMSAYIALARAYAKGTELANKLLRIQEKLVFLMTELATAKTDFHLLAEKNIKLLDENDLREIEDEIDLLESKGETFTGWRHAGETPIDASLDIARTKCRCAEREIIALNEAEQLPRDFPITYINRLSDLLYLYSITA